MGLAAALTALARGDDVTVLEAGRVGDALRAWGADFRFFTPLAMNVPPEVRRLVAGLPPDEALLTGPECGDDVLAPLAASPPLSGRVREGCRVAAIGRSGLTRGDFAGHPIRGERPFRVLAVGAGGEESTLEADVVLDASGGQARPNWTGRGGIPAEGELALGERIARGLGALAAVRGRLAGRTVLLVGHGHSAAHAALLLAAPPASAAGRVIWSVRTPNRRPIVEVAADPLPERARVAAAANDLAESPPPNLTVRRRSSITALRPEGAEIVAEFFGGDTARVDEVVSMTGGRPDHSFLSELALEISPSTEGTARLAAAFSGVTDCLAVPAVGAGDFATGEPGFFFVGSKSYGRSRTFLLRTGLAQIEAILGLP